MSGPTYSQGGALDTVMSAIMGGGGATKEITDKIAATSDLMKSSQDLLSAVSGGSVAPSTASSNSSDIASSKAAAKTDTGLAQAAANQASQSTAQSIEQQFNLSQQRNAFIQGEATKLTSSMDEYGQSHTLADLATQRMADTVSIAARDKHIQELTHGPSFLDDPLKWIGNRFDLHSEIKKQDKELKSFTALDQVIEGTRKGANTAIKQDVDTNQSFNDAQDSITKLNSLASAAKAVEDSQGKMAQLNSQNFANALQLNAQQFTQWVDTERLKNESSSLQLQKEAGDRQKIELPHQIADMDARSDYYNATRDQRMEQVGSDQQLTKALATPGFAQQLGFATPPDAKLVRGLPPEQRNYVELAAMSYGGMPGSNPAERFVRLADSGLSPVGPMNSLLQKFDKLVRQPAEVADPMMPRYEKTTQAALLQNGQSAKMGQDGKLLSPAIDGLDQLVPKMLANREASGDSFYNLGTSASWFHNPVVLEKLGDNPLVPRMQAQSAGAEQDREFKGSDVLAHATELVKGGMPTSAAAQYASSLVRTIDTIHSAITPYSRVGLPAPTNYNIQVKLRAGTAERPVNVDVSDPASVENYLVRAQAAEKASRMQYTNMRGATPPMAPIIQTPQDITGAK